MRLRGIICTSDVDCCTFKKLTSASGPAFKGLVDLHGVARSNASQTLNVNNKDNHR